MQTKAAPAKPQAAAGGAGTTATPSIANKKKLNKADYMFKMLKD